MEYLAEIYLPSGGARLAELVGRLHAAAEELNGERLRVRCVRSIFVPGDETCFCLFDAASEAAVHETGRRADVALIRVTHAVSGHRRDADGEPRNGYARPPTTESERS